MSHFIIVITFTVILRIASGVPPLTCNKIKDISQQKDNQDRYVVILNDPKSYQDAKYVIRKVDQYQRSLEINAVNTYDITVKSELELFENVGLHGVLSKQALLLVSHIANVQPIITHFYNKTC